MVGVALGVHTYVVAERAVRAGTAAALAILAASTLLSTRAAVVGVGQEIGTNLQALAVGVAAVCAGTGPKGAALAASCTAGEATRAAVVGVCLSVHTSPQTAYCIAWTLALSSKTHLTRRTGGCVIDLPVAVVVLTVTDFGLWELLVDATSPLPLAAGLGPITAHAAILCGRRAGVTRAPQILIDLTVAVVVLVITDFSLWVNHGSVALLSGCSIADVFAISLASALSNCTRLPQREVLVDSAITVVVFSITHLRPCRWSAACGPNATRALTCAAFALPKFVRVGAGSAQSLVDSAITVIVFSITHLLLLGALLGVAYCTCLGHVTDVGALREASPKTFLT